MAEKITHADTVPATPERVFAAWMDAAEHGKMTGSKVTDEGDGRFTAWDGYISGHTVSAVPHARIVQSWRTTEFPEGAPDSVLTVQLDPEGDHHTRVTLIHENLPDGQSESYRQGWNNFYFTPMKAYFGSPMERVREAGQKIGEAFEEATHQVENAAKDAVVAVDHARTTARKQAVKAVQAVKRSNKKAAATLRAVGKKVKALVTPKKKQAKAPAPKKAKVKVAAKKATKAKPAAKKAKPAAKPKAKAKARKR